jgi:hypothetical protein
MAITVEVKPDFSAFRTPTAQEIVDEIGCDPVIAEAFLERYTVLPR